MSESWSYDKTIKIIENYKNKRCLWDQQNENFKKSSITKSAWQEIAETVGCSVDVSKRKINSLLASYRRERAKKLKLLQNEDVAADADTTKYKTKWFAYEHLKFLETRQFKKRKQIEKNQLKTTITTPTTSATMKTTKTTAPATAAAAAAATSETYTTEEEEEPIQDDNEEETLYDNYIDKLDELSVATLSQENINNSKSKTSALNSAKFLSNYDNSQKMQKPANPLRSEFGDKLQNAYYLTQNDANGHFGRYVSAKLCNYDENVRCVVEAAIFRIIYLADTNKLATTTTNDDAANKNLTININL